MEHPSPRGSIRGTWREVSFTGDPERYVSKALKMGVCIHRHPVLGDALCLGPLREREIFSFRGIFKKDSRDMQKDL
jgi:hypothetical protein